MLAAVHELDEVLVLCVNIVVWMMRTVTVRCDTYTHLLMMMNS